MTTLDTLLRDKVLLLGRRGHRIPGTLKMKPMEPQMMQISQMDRSHPQAFICAICVICG